MNAIVLLLVIVLLIGGLPTWGWHSYGYWPSGLGFVLLVILIVWLLQRA